MKLKKYILCAFITTGLAFNLTGCDDLFRDAPVDKCQKRMYGKIPCFWTIIFYHGTGT